MVPAEAPGGSLTPFERRVVAHVALPGPGRRPDRSPLIALVSVHGTGLAGTGPAGNQGPGGPERLAGLLPVVEARLRDRAARMDRSRGWHRRRSLSLILINIDDS
ncbi:MAG TPA: hypothetical protein VFQ68_45420 [Streptosporangiaceae bacterium]|nr:hypothetical protein [Streptosporangiaceae bacterium]